MISDKTFYVNNTDFLDKSVTIELSVRDLMIICAGVGQSTVSDRGAVYKDRFELSATDVGDGYEVTYDLYEEMLKIIFKNKG